MRGARFRSEALPRHRRRLQSVDRSVIELWLDGLATRDFEGTLRAFLGAEAPLSAATIMRTNRQLLADFASWNERPLHDLDHSLRRGFITDAAKKKVPIENIKRVTGQRSSNVVLDYIAAATIDEQPPLLEIVNGTECD